MLKNAFPRCLGPKQNRSLTTSHRCHISVAMTRLWKKTYHWIMQKRVTFRTGFKENHWQNDWHIDFHFNGVFIYHDSGLRLGHFFMGYYRRVPWGLPIRSEFWCLLILQIPSYHIAYHAPVISHGSLWRMVTKCDAVEQWIMLNLFQWSDYETHFAYTSQMLVG